MLSKAKTLTGYKLESIDGEVGKIKEFYFDDQHWTVRYLVAETGGWLLGRKVLVSPYALGALLPEKKHIEINLTKKQIQDSPSDYSDLPVSRQFEDDYYGYYGWPMYWGGPYSWGASPYIVRDSANWREYAPDEKSTDAHLRSTHDVSGYHIQATDGEIGHIEDFILDDETWAIRYLIINTGTWWPGRKLLISPRWVTSVSWGESKVYINHSCESIKLSPEYTEDSLINRDYEMELHRHYHRQGYWEQDRMAKEPSH